jgi:hypothetical protein
MRFKRVCQGTARPEFEMPALMAGLEMGIQLAGQRKQKVLEIAVIRRGKNKDSTLLQETMAVVEELGGGVQMFYNLAGDDGIEFVSYDPFYVWVAY